MTQGYDKAHEALAPFLQSQDETQEAQIVVAHINDVIRALGNAGLLVPTGGVVVCKRMGKCSFVFTPGLCPSGDCPMLRAGGK